MTTQKLQSVEAQCFAARQAFDAMSPLSSDVKAQVLVQMADALLANTDTILAANEVDIKNAIENQIETALLDRLRLTAERIAGIADSVRQVANLADPIGDIISEWTNGANQLEIKKKRVPIGVIGMIYEARPNVTADACSLCFKTGNAVVLRGSSSAYETNLAIITVLKTVLSDNKVNDDIFQLLEDVTRDSVSTFVSQVGVLDLVIPRGGAGLIKAVVQSSKVPTIETGVGNCHVYVDKAADLNSAVEIIYNSKTHRPSVCNACESLLIHADVATEFLPKVVARLREGNVLVKGDEKARQIEADLEIATETDWAEEYLDLILPIKIVGSFTEAVEHIRKYGSKHTEVILTEDADAAQKFTEIVDAASVGVNVSTRFTDGGEFGFGAELGISTQMLHARGPMGLAELTSYKYIMTGDHLVRK